MNDIRQSPQYAAFMKDMGWKVERTGKWNAFVKQFPLIGSFIKIQKIQPPIPFEGIELLRKKYRAFKLQIAPNVEQSNNSLEIQFKKHNYLLDTSPNIPTQTIHIDLTQSEKYLFDSFTEAKRRAVRRAIKNGVTAKKSDSIKTFMKMREKQNFPLGFLLTPEMEALWKNFYPENTILILAFNIKKEPVAGILLLFFDTIAYYWYASSTVEGKKLFAPTLLVWEALKLAKKRGAKIFDFEGIYDERFSQATNSWKGFSKFKEGFGGKKISYVGSFVK